VSKCGEKKKIALMSGAKALIYPSIDEDFGIVPVEAMRLGIPVVAWKSGGVKESLVDAVTGIFFEEYNEKSLDGAIKKLEITPIDPINCIRQSLKFSEKKFQESIFSIISELKGEAIEN
jgi:glycosyltransferase involved in cell wall biosynthesis